MTEQEKQSLTRQVIEEWSARDKALKADRFQELNRIARKGQIVFAGSSLMEHFPIYEMLLDRQLPYTIYNRGIGGYTTNELLDTMGPCILDLEPAAVFLNIGTNDMNGPDYVLPEFLERYERIVRSILQKLPEVKLFLLAFYPVNQAAAPQEAAEAFRRDEAGSLRKELTIDGVHMHVEGYRIVLDNLLPVLEELAEKLKAKE